MTATATSVFGSNGSDTVTITGSAGKDLIQLDSSSTQHTVKGLDGADQISHRQTLRNSFLNGNRGKDTITLSDVNSSSILGGGGIDNLVTGSLSTARVNGNKGDDLQTISGGTNSSVFGGQGNDTTTLAGDFTGSSVRGDKGNDTIILGSTSTFANTTINGNAGNDTFNVNQISSFATSTLFGGQGNDNFNATNSTVAMFAFGDSGNDTFTGGTGNDTQVGGIGDDNLFGNTGADSLVGGAGDDFLIYQATAEVTGDIIDAGVNSANGDAILVRSANVDFANLGTTTIRTAGNIERVQITNTLTASFNGTQITGQAININGAGVAGAVSTLDINATDGTAVDLSNLTFTATGSGTAFTINEDIINIDSTAGQDTIVTGTTTRDLFNGNTGDDTFVGGADNDTLNGGAGADTLTGGIGVDTIDLGGGADTDDLVFANATSTAGAAGSLARVTTLGNDAITNYVTANDDLQFSITDFGAIRAGAGAIDQAKVGLVANLTTALNGANQQIDGAGAVSAATGAFFLVGANNGASTSVLYFLTAGADLTQTMTAAVTANEAVAIGSFTNSPLALADFTAIA